VMLSLAQETMVAELP